MPGTEGHVMDERVRFVARMLDGEKMAAQSGAADRQIFTPSDSRFFVKSQD